MGSAQRVEQAEVVVQFGHQRVAVHAATEGGEALEVAEEHGAVFVAPGIGGAFALQFLGRTGGQDVAQQRIASVLLALQFSGALGHGGLQALTVAPQVTLA